MGAGIAAGLSGTFTRHLLQNLSPGLIGLPQALQTCPTAAGAGAAYCGGGGGAWYTGAGDTVVAALSGTFTRHLLQNLSPGLIGLPQALQTCPTGAGAAGAAYCSGGGGGAWYTGAGDAVVADPEAPQVPQNFISGVMGEPQAAQARTGGWATGAGAGAGAVTGAGAGTGAAATGAGTFSAFAPQLPQNFSSGASGAPQVRQLSPPDSDDGDTAAAGNSSTSDAPQFRQNFCEEPTLLPHSGQNGIG